ncbi:MAG: DUF262 domain-containing protein [Flavobacteriales bacterium]|nr:DUF262 domain-containing protein [Flavobacteriales bacterium]
MAKYEIEDDLEQDLDKEVEEDSLDGKGRKIFTQSTDPTVAVLAEKYERGRLILQPEFQRKYVWDAKRASRLVESVLLDIPLPIIYLNEEVNGVQNVIDGQQRLTSLFSFKRGSFPDGSPFQLKSLQALTDLNGLGYKDLSDELQEKFNDCPLRTILFKKESDKGLQYEIFERLNSGSMPLSDQELRNCTLRGPFNELLKELAEDAAFNKLLRVQEPDWRMWNTELVLRFAALHHKTYLKYTSPMKRFMTDFMEAEREMKSLNAEALRKAFRNAVQITNTIFGERAFRRFYAGTAGAKNGKWEPKKFNVSLYDVCMVVFADADKNQVTRNRDLLHDGFIDLMTSDDEFITSIERSTSSKQAIQKRFDKWRGRMDAILKNDVPQDRLFTYEFKQQLFDQNNKCELCGNKITTMDDAAVDHIEQFWQGGTTTEDNGRLTHRYCNNSRKRKEEVA